MFENLFNGIPLTDTEISAFIGGIAWVFARVTGFFMVVNIFAARTVPYQIRAGLAVFTTILIKPFLPDAPSSDVLSVATMLVIGEQLLIGISLGFMVNIFFSVFIFFGQMVGMQIGLGFASMADPANGVQVTVLSQYALILTNLVFLASGGHLMVLDTMVESFRVMPLGHGLEKGLFMKIVEQGSWIFASGALMALPIVISKLIVNAALGIATRAAPQLNIFTLGFPVMLMMGLVELWIWSADYMYHYDILTTHLFQLMRNWLGVP